MAFGRVLGGLQKLNTSMQTVAKTARSTANDVGSTMRRASEQAEQESRRILTGLAKLKQDATPRIKDLEYDLEGMAQQGNAWAESLLDIIRQVQQGTVDAGKAIGSLNDGVILFEGRMQSVKGVLADLLPTTGEVQGKIRDLAEELKRADIGELVDRLRGQYNEYAQMLADTVDAFARGEVTLERVVQLAQQIGKQMDGSETGVLADALNEAVLSGQF